MTPTATPAKSIEEVLSEKKGIKGGQIDQVIFRYHSMISYLIVAMFIGIIAILSLPSSQRQLRYSDLGQLKQRNPGIQAIPIHNTSQNSSIQVTRLPKTLKSSLR